MIPISDIGSFLKTLRVEHHLTQDQVARACDIALITYSRYESGSRVPKVPIAEKLCILFDITLGELYTGSKAASKIDSNVSSFNTATMSDKNLQIALFGDASDEITHDDLEDIKLYARFLLARKTGSFV